MNLGTILPTRSGLREADAHADRLRLKLEQAGDAMFRGCQKRVLAGEVRWYASSDRYAVMGRNGQPRWFRVTPDGDFAEKGR